jgi:hypothetical protein
MAVENGIAGNMEWYLAKFNGVAWSTTKIEEAGDSGGVDEAWGLITIADANTVSAYFDYSYTGYLRQYDTFNGGTDWSLTETWCSYLSGGSVSRVFNGTSDFWCFFQTYSPGYAAAALGTFSTSTVWIEFNSIDASPNHSHFYMYYGNAVASSSSNGTATFVVYDNFERGNNGDTIGGDWTVALGDVKISTEHTVSGTRSGKWLGGANIPVATIPAPSAVSYRVEWWMWKENNLGDMYWQHGDGAWTTTLIIDGFENIQYFDGILQDTGQNMVADSWQDYAIDDINFVADTYDIWYNGLKVQDDAGMANVAGNGVNKFAFYATENTIGDDYYIDDLIARVWDDPEPTWGTWGSEEPSPTAGSLSIYIDSILYDTTPWISGNVTDNGNGWIFVEQGAMPYMFYHKIWIGGTLRQSIELELDTTFTDLSGNGQDTTPSFRSSGTVGLTATLLTFSPYPYVPITYENQVYNYLNPLIVVVYSALMLVIVLKILQQSTLTALLFGAVAIYIGNACVTIINEAVRALLTG